MTTAAIGETVRMAAAGDYDINLAKLNNMPSRRSWQQTKPSSTRVSRMIAAPSCEAIAWVDLIRSA